MYLKIIMCDLPFKQDNNSGKLIRTFEPSVDQNELKWHRDLEDRIVIPLIENDWYFQRDNQLPEKINKPIFIKAKEWHRVIKGTTKLVVEIKKK